MIRTAQQLFDSTEQARDRPREDGFIVPPMGKKVEYRTMSGHGHSHDGGCGHSHSAEDKEGAERGTLFSLYLKIDKERVECLNEERDGSGKDVFKPWDKRLEKDLVIIFRHMLY